MTIWTPTLEEGIPRYLAIADAVAHDLKAGRLEPGERLPTHRDLAKALRVTVGTVSRGYAEAERRGLTVGEVGRGTYLRGPSAPMSWRDPREIDLGAGPEPPLPEDAETHAVDLTLSLPVTLPEEGRLFTDTLRHIAEDPRAVELLAYRQESGSHHQRTVAAQWLRRLDLQAEAEDILITAGSQHGLNVVLSSLFNPGRVLLTGALTYPAIKSQARASGLKLRGLDLDGEGVIPEALEEACLKEPKPAALYLVPTLQNPTGVTMSGARRQEIARIVEKHGLWLIEDDVHAFMLEEPMTPISALIPERSIYLASVAKCLAPGLRTGYILAPPSLRVRLLAGIHTTLWMAPPLMVEVTSRWIESGTADYLIAAKRQEIEKRQQLALRLLVNAPAGTHCRSHPASYHLWLELPEPWCADEVVTQARDRGVYVLGAGAFAIGRRNLPHALRLSIGVPERRELERGLRILIDLLASGGAPAY